MVQSISDKSAKITVMRFEL